MESALVLSPYAYLIHITCNTCTYCIIIIITHIHHLYIYIILYTTAPKRKTRVVKPAVQVDDSDIKGKHLYMEILYEYTHYYDNSIQKNHMTMH